MGSQTHLLPSGLLRGGPLRRALAAAVVTVLTMVAGAAPGAAQAQCGDVSPGGRVVACGNMHLSGDTTAVTAIDLPAPASIDLTAVGLIGKPEGFDVEGERLFGGFLIIQDTPDRKGVGLLGGQFGEDSLFGRFFPYVNNVFPDAIESNRLDLPAGPYLLYVISEGAPVTVTLRLDGLTGSSHLAPSHETPSGVRRLSPRMPGVDANANLYSSGYQQRIEQPGFLMLVNSLEHTAHVVAARGDCGYTQPVDESTAFAPGCPGRATADGSTYFTGTEVATQAPWWHRSEFFTKPGAAPGTYGLGFWQATAGVTPKADAMALWLELAAPPT